MDFESIYQASLKPTNNEKLQEGMNTSEAAQVVKMSLLHDRDMWEETMGKEVTSAVETLMMNTFSRRNDCLF